MDARLIAGGAATGGAGSCDGVAGAADRLGGDAGDDWHGIDRGYVRLADGREAARLAALVGPATRLDRRGVSEAWGHIRPSDRTVFAGLRMTPRRLAPASTRASPSRTSRDDDFQRALVAAVARIATRARNPAIALGGGLDAAVVAAAWKRAGATLPALVTIETGLAGYDEVAEARVIAGALGGALDVVRIPAGDVAGALAAAVAACERPVYNLHPVARFAFARAVRARGIDTLVTGDGADAVCAGEPDDDYVPIVAALVRASGLALASPFFDPAVVRAALARGVDRDKRGLRAVAAALGVPAWIARRPKSPRWFPALDLTAMWREDAVARLAREVDLPALPGLPARRDPCGDACGPRDGARGDRDRERVGWISLDLLARALRGDP